VNLSGYFSATFVKLLKLVVISSDEKNLLGHTYIANMLFPSVEQKGTKETWVC
jgi:hypothetical protein